VKARLGGLLGMWTFAALSVLAMPHGWTPLGGLCLVMVFASGAFAATAEVDR
jgi:hypothetical protein